MFRRYLFATIVIPALMILATAAALGQTGELRGHVNLKQADGQTVPASEAVIDVYRTDLPGKYPTKANKKGEFVFAGLPYVGTYVIAVSHPAAQPTWLPNVKAGRGVDYEIILSPGDGRRLAQDEVKAALAKSGDSSPAASGESAEERAKREELLRKNAEIEAKNKKAEQSNAIVGQSFTAGNEAIKAKNYDAAIAHYDEGLKADPEHPGAPSLLTNKAIALKARAVDRYNAAIRSSDDAAKTSGIEEAKKDWKEAAEAANKAVEMLKAQPAPTEMTALNNYKSNLYFALLSRADAMRFFATKVDQSQANAGLVAFQEYIAAETDAAKKAKAQLDAAQMLLDAGSADTAYAEYQKLITAQPNDPDANLGAGLALFASGDKAKYQEAANYLQHFVDVAPDAHKFKADAKAILAELKNTEKVVPERTTPARRRRP